jgi:uncharacterized C2H2 Zn-finger protein
MNHPEIEVWICESCGMKLKTYDEYVKHTNKHTEEDLEIEKHDDKDDMEYDEDNDYRETQND